MANRHVCEYIRALDKREAKTALLAVEMIASYGMPVGREVFETCLWIGRFLESWRDVSGGEGALVYRRDVKAYLCGSAKAKDANVRQAIIDKYDGTGGGKCKQIGTKNAPGPLFGLRGDEWAALGVTLTFRANMDANTHRRSE